LPKAHPDALRGGDAGRNAEILRRLLNGEPGAARDIVLLNAAAALLIAGVEPRLESGLQRAASAIDSGRAAAVLDRLVALSMGSAEAAAS
jgi:anthranilate phosphoribosyltransferase